jgi:hypothetical protein
MLNKLLLLLLLKMVLISLAKLQFLVEILR